MALVSKKIVKRVRQQAVKAIKNTARALKKTGEQYITSTVKDFQDGKYAKGYLDVLNAELVLANPAQTANLIAQRAAVPVAKAIGNKVIGRKNTENISKRVGQARKLYAAYTIAEGLMNDPANTIANVYAYNKSDEAAKKFIKNYGK